MKIIPAAGEASRENSTLVAGSSSRQQRTTGLDPKQANGHHADGSVDT